VRSRSKTVRKPGPETASNPKQRAPGYPNGQPGGYDIPASSPGSVTPSAPVAVRRTSRRLLRNWRVRSRLLLLIIIPTASAIALGGISIAASVRNALAYQRAQKLATLGRDIVQLAQGLEDERDQIVVFIAMPPAVGGRSALATGPQAANRALQLQVIGREYAVTNAEVAAVRGLLSQIGGSYSPQAQQTASVALTALSGLRFLSTEATGSKLPALVVVQQYTLIIDDVLAMDSQISQASNDPQIAQTVQVLGLITAMQEEASQQRAILTAALLQGSFGAGDVAALQSAESAQQNNLKSFNVSASVAQSQLYGASLNRSLFPTVTADESAAILTAQAHNSSLTKDTTSPYEWYGAMSSIVDVQLASVAHTLTSAIIARTQVLRRQAIVAALIVGAAVIVILILALILTMLIGRSMVRPLRRLRAGALDVAGVRLPEAVRRMSEAEGDNVQMDVDPIEVDSQDEIGEVARAFDQVHREAIRLAANEAALRGNVNAMFVNLSRRSQSLVERQIKLIDDLEQGEQDPDRLGNLFQMDHLATRMRRNSENLLVLAGHESARRWNQPVQLVDVLRAAISEIEQYERVTLNIQPGISVRGPAVSDVVHLIAELAENATSFSSAETAVTVSGQMLSSGGVLLDITDSGVGMDAEEMAHANWRLDNPPVVDVAVSRRMGLFVVARLAARHGIRVRLRQAADAGLTALVWLPDEVISREGEGQDVSSGWLAESAARPAIEPGVPQRPSGRVGLRDDWSEPGRGAMVPDVGAARVPRFTPAEAVGENGATKVGQLGPHRIPGAGPHPGKPVTSTEPIPAAGAGSGEPTAGEPELGAPIAAGGDLMPELSAWAGEDAGQPVLSAPVEDATMPATDSFHIAGYPSSPAGPDGDVVVPPAASLREENRLPIFEAVESDWFRRGRPSLDWAGGKAASSVTASWASPGDDGWRTAELAAAPTSGGTTSAGLPRRVPKANLIPGTAADAPVGAAAPVRSAAATRERFASLQRGIREGRAASAAMAEEPEDVGGDE
jgi:signal transduction histidine kinase